MGYEIYNWVYGEIVDPEHRVFVILHPGTDLVTWAHEDRSSVTQMEIKTGLLSNDESQLIDWEPGTVPQVSRSFYHAIGSIRSAIENDLYPDGSDIPSDD